MEIEYILHEGFVRGVFLRDVRGDFLLSKLGLRSVHGFLGNRTW